jgi:hypothetical protein
MSISWTTFANVNWTNQPCDSSDTVKNRPIKDTFNTNTSSLTVKCSASIYDSRFGTLNNYSTTVPSRKNLWQPIAEHRRVKPEDVVDVYGFISKNRSDFIEWNLYIDPKFYGLDQVSDTRYKVPANGREIIANNLLKYAAEWNKRYIQEVEKDFFPGLFQSASASVERFNFQERVEPIKAAASSQTPTQSNVNVQPVAAQSSRAETDRMNAEAQAARERQQELEQRLIVQAAEAEAAKRRQQELEAQLAAAQSTAQSQPTAVSIRNAHALVIGNAAYPGSGRLDNPVNDANAISQKLRSMGFIVTMVTDANRQRLVQAMAQFRRSAASADLSLLFYSGHGVQIFGTNYILPTDVDQTDTAQATIQGVRLNEVIGNFMPGKTKIVFLDACRDNPLQRTGDRSVTKGLAPISVAEGTLISYATKDGQTAADGVGSKNSPFTQALLEHLNDPQDIGVVLRKVREKVMRATGGKQQPWEYGSLTGGELVLSAIKPR